jgi:hypothetical protein
MPDCRWVQRDVVAITGVEPLVDGGWNVHLGREMAVCLIVIPGGELLCTSPCVNPRERELARKREPEHENECGKSREKYHMVYGIVPYGIGSVPYGIWYRTVWYWTAGWQNCMYV